MISGCSGICPCLFCLTHRCYSTLVSLRINWIFVNAINLKSATLSPHYALSARHSLDLSFLLPYLCLADSSPGINLTSSGKFFIQGYILLLHALKWCIISMSHWQLFSKKSFKVMLRFGICLLNGFITLLTWYAMSNYVQGGGNYTLKKYFFLGGFLKTYIWSWDFF